MRYRWCMLWYTRALFSIYSPPYVAFFFGFVFPTHTAVPVSACFTMFRRTQPRRSHLHVTTQKIDTHKTGHQAQAQAQAQAHVSSTQQTRYSVAHQNKTKKLIQDPTKHLPGTTTRCTIMHTSRYEYRNVDFCEAWSLQQTPPPPKKKIKDTTTKPTSLSPSLAKKKRRCGTVFEL